ncbi:MAG: hypothetical protein V4556_10470 [Bacteroidota bacterium]
MCLATFGILFILVQQQYKPGVFSIILVNHILQVIAAVLLANYLNKDINERSPYISKALVVSLVGIIFLFIPLIIYQRSLPTLTLNKLKEYAQEFSIGKVLYCYIIALVATSLLSAVAFVFGSITQIIISLIKIKWFFFLLFGFMVFLKQEKKRVFYLLVLFEFLSGFFSFFSDFKTVIYYLIILYVTFIEKVNLKSLLLAFTAGIFLVFIGLFWTSIKNDYRAFLNSGSQTQEIDVSQNDAYNKLYDLSSSVDQDVLANSTISLLDRLQYIYHFSKAIETVPDKIPFQNGNNWLDNLEFSTTPRFLNPDKPKINNSIKTTKYTGIRYLGADKGVSFSLGYFAEAYIDFGFLGMPIFLLGIGFLYTIIANYLKKNSSDNPLFAYAVLGSFFMEFYGFEMDGTYLIGRLFSSFLTYFILIKFFFPSILEFIKVRDEPEYY